MVTHQTNTHTYILLGDDGSNKYWWMNMADSPFKRAETEPIGVVPPCTLNAGCTAASTNVNLIKNDGQPLDLSKNPFLNGIYVAELPQAQRLQAQPQPHQTVFIHSDSAAGCTHGQQPQQQQYVQQPQALAQVAPLPKPIVGNQVYVNSVNEISSYDNAPNGNGIEYLFIYLHGN